MSEALNVLADPEYGAMLDPMDKEAELGMVAITDPPAPARLLNLENS